MDGHPQQLTYPHPEPPEPGAAIEVAEGILGSATHMLVK